MVDERLRAWHAGQSYWRRITDVNSASVGIEIVNPGHELGYRPFPEAQMAALLPLLSEIVGRHGVTPANVVGHSDRSEEHTYELQSLMRISYAVFFSNKKTHT